MRVIAPIGLSALTAVHVDGVDASVYFHLYDLNEGRPLLPNLRELCWSQASYGDPRLLTLASPSLRRIHLEIYHHHQSNHPFLPQATPPSPQDYMLRGLLETILLKAHEVEEVVFVGPGWHSVALTPLGRWPKLRAVQTLSILPCEYAQNWEGAEECYLCPIC